MSCPFIFWLFYFDSFPKELLITEGEIVLKLETEVSGARVGRFYRGGKEVEWEGLVRTQSVYSKEVNANVMSDDDVVLESEEIILPKKDLKDLN